MRGNDRPAGRRADGGATVRVHLDGRQARDALDVDDMRRRAPALAQLCHEIGSARERAHLPQPER